MKSQTLSRRIRSAEDIQIGAFIVVLLTQYQVLPDTIETDVAGTRLEPVEVTMIPSEAGTPMKVIALSLPFLMAESAQGQRFVVDTRRHVLARVDQAYAMAAKPAEDKKKSNGKKSRERKGKGRGKKK